MPNWWKNFSWEWFFDSIAERSPSFVKVIVVTGKSFLYYHGMTRAASLTYTTLVAVVPLLILLTSITLAVGFGNFMSDYLPIVLDVLNLDWPTEQITDIVKNAEHSDSSAPSAFLSPSSSLSEAWRPTSTWCGRSRLRGPYSGRSRSTPRSWSFSRVSSGCSRDS